MLDGILWIVKTDACWRNLPKDYPPYQTCHRRFQLWVEEGVFDKVMEALTRDLQECDGMFSLAKKRLPVERTKRGKGTKIMTITDAGGVVLFVSVQSASPYEVALVEKTIVTLCI